MNYVSREELAWAKLDLDLNRTKTTIILSHNSLAGTTEPGDNADLAYRVVTNSQEVYDLTDQHGRVIAWMHGHNHDYKIVPRSNRLYVSNGRIGGFPRAIEGAPPAMANKPHHGGRSIAGPQRQYRFHGVRPLGFRGTDLAWFLIKGTVDVHKPSESAVGIRRVCDSQVFRLDQTGLTLHPLGSPDGATVLECPDNGRGLRGYYRLAPGQKIQLRLEFATISPGATVKPVLYFASSDRQLLGSVSAESLTLQPNAPTVRFDFQVPSVSPARTIYSNPSSDVCLNCWVETSFSGFRSPIQIKSLQMIAESGQTPNMALKIEDEYHAGRGSRQPVTVAASSSNREVVEAQLSAGGLGAFHIRETPQWQARNAPVVMKDQTLRIGPLRNDFSSKKRRSWHRLHPRQNHMCIVWEDLVQPVLNSMIQRRKKLEVAAKEITGSGEIEVICGSAPKGVAGARTLSYANGRLLCQMSEPGTFTAIF